MKIIRILLWFLLIAVALWAQGRSQPSFEAQCQRLDQQMASAEELLRLFPDSQAENYLRQAERLAMEARNLYADRQFGLAQQKLKLAFDLLERALAILTDVPSQRLQQEVEELIRRAEQIVPVSGNQEAERLLMRSKEHLRLAEQAFRGRQAQRGLEYLRLAKSLAERSIGLAERSKGDDGTVIEGERMRFQELLQKAEAAVAECHHPRAQRLLQQARRQAEGVEVFIRRREMAMAIGLYANATRLLLRAIDLCEGRSFSEGEQVKEEVEWLDGLIAQIQSNAALHASPKRRLILAKALQLQKQAREALALQQYGVALRRIELARTLLTHSWSENVTQEGTRQELTRLEQDIEKLRSQLTGNPDRPWMQTLLRAADNCARDADRYLQQDRLRLALLSILAGNRFLTLIRTATANAASPSTLQAQQQLEKVQQKLDGSSNHATGEESLEEIAFARDLLQRAQQALAQNDAQLAIEYIRLADELAEKKME